MEHIKEVPVTRTELEAERNALSIIQRMRDLLAASLLTSNPATEGEHAYPDQNLQRPSLVEPERARTLPSE